MENSKLVKQLVDKLSRPLQDAADALTSLAASARLWVDLERRRFYKDFPHIDVNPASIGVAKYARPEVDKPEEEGDVFPTEKEDRWQGIGHRERKRLEAEERTSSRLARQKNRRAS